ncbi:putative zinc finger protein, partial [Orchesella cincta]
CFIKLKRLKSCKLPSSSSSRRQNRGTKSPKTIRNTASKKEYKCTICFKPYRSYQGLAHHKRSHTNERPYGCKIVPEILNPQSIQTLKSHFCPQCPASFALSSGLRSHIRVVHEKDQRTKRKCNICHKILAKSHIAAHLKCHAKKMPFACVMCDKPFYALNNLKLHIQTKHLQERPFSCSKCPATFPVKYNLTHHILRVHIFDEWYTLKCVCDKTFHTEYALNQHMTSHTGEKHYKCATCGKRYGSSADLQRDVVSMNTFLRTRERNRFRISCARLDLAKMFPYIPSGGIQNTQ